MKEAAPRIAYDLMSETELERDGQYHPHQAELGETAATVEQTSSSMASSPESTWAKVTSFLTGSTRASPSRSTISSFYLSLDSSPRSFCAVVVQSCS